jgi:hypothetical protein
MQWARDGAAILRSGDDDLGVGELTLEHGVGAFLVGGGDQGVALGLEPRAETELVLGGTEKLGDLLGVDATL